MPIWTPKPRQYPSVLQKKVQAKLLVQPIGDVAKFVHSLDLCFDIHHQHLLYLLHLVHWCLMAALNSQLGSKFFQQVDRPLPITQCKGRE